MSHTEPRPHFRAASLQDTSLVGQLKAPSALSRGLNRWDQCEAMAGLVAAFLLAFGPLTVATLVLILALLLAEWKVAGAAAIVVTVTCPMALWLTRMAESASRRFIPAGQSPPETAAPCSAPRRRGVPLLPCYWRLNCRRYRCCAVSAGTVVAGEFRRRNWTGHVCRRVGPTRTPLERSCKRSTSCCLQLPLQLRSKCLFGVGCHHRIWITECDESRLAKPICH